MTMMAGNLRREVLKVFKQLHKTRKNVFHGDEHALKIARSKINEEYRKNQHIKDITAISEMNRYAQEVEYELRTTVVRLIEKKPGLYEAQITSDTVLIDNAKLDECLNATTKTEPVKSRKK